MKIIIHRGTNQIGGSVVEISTDSTRIFLDLGSPLPDGNEDKPLEIEGVTTGSPNCDGILFSHYHGDHIGMLANVLPGIPFYMGNVSKEIYMILQERLRQGIPEIVQRARTFTAATPFNIGDIQITSFMVDHSAFDAYMFLIEAEGKRVLYTGDFRTHGFRGKAVLPMLRKYVGQVDVLITEGTMLSRADVEVKSEHVLQQEIRQRMEEYKYVFVVCSSTNIDRIGSVYQSVPYGKYFLCDPYQQSVLQKVDALCGHHTELYRFKKVHTYGKNLDENMNAKGFCMLIRNRFTYRDVVEKYKREYPDDTVIIYSMWQGYLGQPGNPYHELLDGFKNIEYLHTSGHATFQSIIDVCNTVRPTTAIIPIHSENRHKMDAANQLFHIVYLDDGEIYTI
jgi:ribonuclease J